jgi:tetratricopeptide (TPR) repeat protein
MLTQEQAVEVRVMKAVKQYELALRLSPRDIFLMHKQGLAMLDQGNEAGALAMLEQLLSVDAEAVRWSTAVAGLKGRPMWQRYQRNSDRKDLATARDAYAAGLEANPHSHYMADNVGQHSLLLGEADAAKAAFSTALEGVD